MAWQELGLGGGFCLVHDVFVCLVIEPKNPLPSFVEVFGLNGSKVVKSSAPITWNGLLVLIVSN